MNKFFIVRHRNNDICKEELQKVIEEISLDFHDTQIISQNNNYYGFQEKKQDYNNIVLGNPIKTKEGFKEDGSYVKIKSSSQSIIFYGDTFRSKSLYYYIDEEIFFITNSIKASVFLKNKFELNKVALSNFLSSGNIGKFDLWDSETKIVNEKLEYEFKYDTWEIITKHEKLYLDDDFENIEDIIIYNLKESIQNIKDQNVIVPLSGGYDSRLIFNLMRLEGRNVKAINWGKAINEKFICDKKAAILQAKNLKFELKDFILPNKIDDVHNFIKKYTFLGECKLDHLNAFSDNFKIWDYLHQNNIKYIVRGDLPFPTGDYINPIKARQRLDYLSFKDYINLYDFCIDQSLQENNENYSFSRKKTESKIQWRDRLYTDIRLPTAINSFYDITNSYTETILPLMSYRLFNKYNQLSDKEKSDKKFVKDFSKKIDQSNVTFNTCPSIPSLIELFDKEIPYLVQYLTDEVSKEIFSEEMIDDLLIKLNSNSTSVSITNNRNFINFAKSILPSKIKYYLKSKQPINLNIIQLSYRVVMADIYIKSLQK